MKKLLTFLTIVVLGTTMWAQAPQGINYQAVARDASGNVLDAVQGTVRISILDAIGGNVLYQEEHSVTTNQFGLFNVLIGQGTALQGTFSTVNWSLGDKYLQVEADFGSGLEDMGTTQLVSVPYALYAETSGDGPPGKNSLLTTSSTTTTCPNGGYTVTVGIDLNGNNTLDAGETTGTFEICNGQDGSATSLIAGNGIDIDFTTNTISNTGDLDSLDDIITNAVLNGNNLEITEGGTVWTINLSSLMNDTSNTNEIQVLSMSGNTITLSNGGGNINLSSTTPVTGDVLYWNGSNWVAQPLPANTDNQNLSNGGKTGNNQTIDIQNGMGVTFSVADADSVVGNEYNTAFAINAGNLEITDGGGTLSVPLSSLTDGDWTTSGNNIYNGNTGNVGIGTTTPAAKLHVYNVLDTGLYVQNQGADGKAGYFHITSSSFGTANYSVIARNEGNAPSNYGVYTQVTGGSGTNNYGIYSDVTAGTNRWAGYFLGGNVYMQNNVGIGTTTPEAKLHVALPNSTATKVLQLGHGNQPSREWSFDVDAISKFTINNEGNGTPFTAMAIDPNTGNVGIGTSSPTEKLHIDGGMVRISNSTNFTTIGFSGVNSEINVANALQISANGTNSVFVIDDVDAYFNVNTHVAGNFQLQDGTQANGYILVSDASGNASWVNPTTISTADDGDWVTGANGVYNTTDNIGIGITSPNYLLHLHASTGSTVLQLTNSNTNSTATDGFQLQVTNLGGVRLMNQENTAMFFGTNNTDRMVITGSGNVGIGTNTPANKLHVEDGAITVTRNSSSAGMYASTYGNYSLVALRNAGGTISSPTATSASQILGRLSFGGYDGTLYQEAAIIESRSEAAFSSTESPGSLRFYTTPFSSTAPLQRMIISPDGYVGVGTYTPATILHVETSTSPASEAVWFRNMSTANNENRALKAESNGAPNTNMGIWAQGNGGNYSTGLYARGQGGTLSSTGIEVNAYGSPNNYGVKADLFFATTGNSFAIYGVARGTGSTTNYGLYASASNASTNWAGYFAQGNVYVADTLGIGTTAPATKLHVTSNSATTPELTIENTSNNRSVTFNSNGEIEAGTTGQTLYLNRYVNGNVILANGGGDVGIGTNAPDGILHVMDTINVIDGTDGAYIYIQNAVSTTGVMTGIKFRTDGVNAGTNARYKSGIAHVKTGSWGVGDMVFMLNNAGSNASVELSDEKMRITSTGNVGIGTNTPTSKLDVNGTIAVAPKIITTGSPSLIPLDSSIIIITAGSNQTYLPKANTCPGRIYKFVLYPGASLGINAYSGSSDTIEIDGTSYTIAALSSGAQTIGLTLISDGVSKWYVIDKF